MKNLVFNSDDFGISEETNLAIMEGYSEGAVTSTCILANGKFYKHGIDEVLPEIPSIGRGVHLNIIEGKSLTAPSLIINSDREFNKSYAYFLYNSCNKKFLKQIEDEFRAQIEKIMSDTEIDHINSHVHTHAIPNIFNLVVKLALEYKIKFIRTQYERPYFVFKKMLDKKYPVNLLKLGLLNTFSTINKGVVRNLNSKGDKKININDFIIGVGYTGYMDENSISRGLSALKNINNDTVTEIIIHPRSLGYGGYTSNYKEFLASLNPDIRTTIVDLGFNLTNYRDLPL